MKKILNYFTIFEWCLWLGSLATILITFFAMGNTDYRQLACSLVGVTGLIFIEKGSLVGMIITLIFSALYGIVSYFCAYYGEMITYLGMTSPIALIGIFTWFRHRREDEKGKVVINEIHGKEYGILAVISLIVTVSFYFILRALNTANLIISTISVLTSFVAAYLQLRRSRFYAIGYTLNDIVLITLWTLQAVNDIRYLAMVSCSVAFLVNDIYGFINWTRMLHAQCQKATGIPKQAE